MQIYFTVCISFSTMDSSSHLSNIKSDKIVSFYSMLHKAVLFITQHILYNKTNKQNTAMQCLANGKWQMVCDWFEDIVFILLLIFCHI